MRAGTYLQENKMHPHGKMLSKGREACNHEHVFDQEKCEKLELSLGWKRVVLHGKRGAEVEMAASLLRQEKSLK